MANFPASLPSSSPATHQVVLDEIIAIATELGTDPAGLEATVKDRLGVIEAHGYRPAQHGMLAWSADPYYSTNSLAAGQLTAGTLYSVRLFTPSAITVTNVCLIITAAGVTLTASNNRAALYNSSGTLLDQTADQATNWQSTGYKAMALGTPQAVPAGFMDVAWWWNGTTQPALLRMSNNSIGANANLTGNGIRVAQLSNTGLTATAPGTLGTKTAHAMGVWVGVS